MIFFKSEVLAISVIPLFQMFNCFPTQNLPILCGIDSYEDRMYGCQIDPKDTQQPTSSAPEDYALLPDDTTQDVQSPTVGMRRASVYLPKCVENTFDDLYGCRESNEANEYEDKIKQVVHNDIRDSKIMNNILRQPPDQADTNSKRYELRKCGINSYEDDMYGCQEDNDIKSDKIEAISYNIKHNNIMSPSSHASIENFRKNRQFRIRGKDSVEYKIYRSQGLYSVDTVLTKIPSVHKKNMMRRFRLALNTKQKSIKYMTNTSEKFKSTIKAMKPLKTSIRTKHRKKPQSTTKSPEPTIRAIQPIGRVNTPKHTTTHGPNRTRKPPTKHLLTTASKSTKKLINLLDFLKFIEPRKKKIPKLLPTTTPESTITTLKQKTRVIKPLRTKKTPKCKPTPKSITKYIPKPKTSSKHTKRVKKPLRTTRIGKPKTTLKTIPKARAELKKNARPLRRNSRKETTLKSTKTSKPMKQRLTQRKSPIPSKTNTHKKQKRSTKSKAQVPPFMENKESNNKNLFNLVKHVYKNAITPM